MTNYLEDSRMLIPNKGATICITEPDDAENVGIFALNFASVLPRHVYSTGVAGHYFNFGEAVKVSKGEPLRVQFAAAGDACVYAVKQVGQMVYLYGITIESLIGWTPPARKDDIDEARLLSTWPVPRADIVDLTPLADTETHPNLKGTADLLMSFVKTFTVHKIRSVADSEKWVKQPYEKNVKQALLQGELADRRVAQLRASRGRRSEAAANSGDGGQDAGDVWAVLREAVQRAIPFYNEPFEERFAGGDNNGRFFNVALDEATGQPTPETIDELRAFLQCAPPSLSHARNIRL